VIALALAAIALAVTPAACGGGDDPETTTSAAPSAAAPSGGATPPSDLGDLPPEFVKCMADQGFEIESEAEVHSAPPKVLRACFGLLH
jgi:hypothetical protein